MAKKVKPGGESHAIRMATGILLSLIHIFTWAETRNNMTSRLSGAPASTGKWNNETLSLIHI